MYQKGQKRECHTQNMLLFKDGSPLQERNLRPNGPGSNKNNVDMVEKQNIQRLETKKRHQTVMILRKVSLG